MIFFLQRASHIGLLAQQLGGPLQQVAVVEHQPREPNLASIVACVHEQLDGQAVDMLAPGGEVGRHDRLAELAEQLLKLGAKRPGVGGDPLPSFHDDLGGPVPDGQQRGEIGRPAGT